jgi:hypothetical protein
MYVNDIEVGRTNALKSIAIDFGSHRNLRQAKRAEWQARKKKSKGQKNTLERLRRSSFVVLTLHYIRKCRELINPLINSFIRSFY